MRLRQNKASKKGIKQAQCKNKPNEKVYKKARNVQV